jgi:hypothetical protein
LLGGAQQCGARVTGAAGPRARWASPRA